LIPEEKRPFKVKEVLKLSFLEGEDGQILNSQGFSRAILFSAFHHFDTITINLAALTKLIWLTHSDSPAGAAELWTGNLHHLWSTPLR